MPSITITVDAPEGFRISVDQRSDTESRVAPDRDQIERYFHHYLSENGRKLYRAAALLEQHRGPGYTLSDIAASLSIDYPSAQSFHRTSGRSGRRWEHDTGTEPPIQLINTAYDWVEEEHGMRSRYELPASVAEVIGNLN